MNKHIDFKPIWSYRKHITTELTLRNMNKSNGICRLCSNSLENQRHLLLECPNSARLWSDLKNILNNEIETTSLFEENIYICTIAAELSSTILTVKWVIWKQRCTIRYQDNANIGYTHYKTLLKNELRELKLIRQQNTPIHNKIINIL